MKILPTGIAVIEGDRWISKWVEGRGSLQHDYQTLPEVLGIIQPGWHVLDCGGCIGDTAKPFLDRVGPTGFVYVMEPNREAYECLAHNLARFAGDNVKIQQAAVGDAHGTMRIATGPNAGGAYLNDSEGETVCVVPIDAMALERLDFLKADVEGFELRALKGAVQTISRFHPKMLIEINHGALERQGTSAEEIYAWLAEHGYQWREVVPSPDGPQNTPQTDILCEWVGPPSVERLTETRMNQIAAVLIPPIVPWESFEQTMQEIRRHALALKPFCGKGRRTAKVREELKAAGVIR